uniref:Uncharacterized protein n=1 Tax=Anguilla anguilla TaxID=7936 RepID=A0A0E9X2D5_ANGAN
MGTRNVKSLQSPGLDVMSCSGCHLFIASYGRFVSLCSFIKQCESCEGMTLHHFRAYYLSLNIISYLNPNSRNLKQN